MNSIMAALDLKVDSASSLYNHAKITATKSGLTVPFGRPVKPIVIPKGRWQIVDKVTNTVVATKTSRLKARAARAQGQIVRDSKKA